MILMINGIYYYVFEKYFNHIGKTKEISKICCDIHQKYAWYMKQKYV